jgi:hypothetical protein
MCQKLCSSFFEVGISEATELKMLHEDLEMNNVSARWLPKLLNPERKLWRQHVCEENLGAVTDDEEIFSKIIVGDDTWVYYWDPPIKQESMQWVLKRFPPPKKFKNAAFIRKAAS